MSVYLVYICACQRKYYQLRLTKKSGTTLRNRPKRRNGHYPTLLIRYFQTTLKMEKHVANYLKAFGYDGSSFIACELCGDKATDIHHIEPRSKFGSTRKVEQDHPDNLIALCRLCHEFAHRHSIEFKSRIKSFLELRNQKHQ